MKIAIGAGFFAGDGKAAASAGSASPADGLRAGKDPADGAFAKLAAALGEPGGFSMGHALSGENVDAFPRTFSERDGRDPAETFLEDLGLIPDCAQFLAQPFNALSSAPRSFAAAAPEAFAVAVPQTFVIAVPLGGAATSLTESVFPARGNAAGELGTVAALEREIAALSPDIVESKISFIPDPGANGASPALVGGEGRMRVPTLARHNASAELEALLGAAPGNGAESVPGSASLARLLNAKTPQTLSALPPGNPDLRAAALARWAGLAEARLPGSINSPEQGSDAVSDVATVTEEIVTPLGRELRSEQVRLEQATAPIEAQVREPNASEGEAQLRSGNALLVHVAAGAKHGTTEGMEAALAVKNEGMRLETANDAIVSGEVQSAEGKVEAKGIGIALAEKQGGDKGGERNGNESGRREGDPERSQKGPSTASRAPRSRAEESVAGENALAFSPAFERNAHVGSAEPATGVDSARDLVSSRVAKAGMQLAHAGGGTARIQVVDKQLGTIEVSVKMRARGEVSVEIATSSAELRDELERNADKIRGRLEAQNLQLMDLKFAVEGASASADARSGDRQQDQQRSGQDPQPNPGSSNHGTQGWQQASHGDGRGADSGFRKELQGGGGEGREAAPAALREAFNRQTKVQRQANGSLKVSA